MQKHLIKVVFVSAMAVQAHGSYATDFDISASAKHTIAVWKSMDTAYLQHDESLLNKEERSRDAQVSLYAKSLVASLKGDFNESISLAEKCVNHNSIDESSKFMHFVCLLDVSRNYGYEFEMKKHYIYIYNARKYVQKQKRQRGLLFKNKIFNDFMNSSSFIRADPREWLDTHLAVRKNFESMKMQNGFVRVMVSGKSVPMLVDTGSSGITMTVSDIAKYGLWNKLHFVSNGSFEYGYNRAYKIIGIYTAKNVVIGPMIFTDPYIDVVDTKDATSPFYSAIGLNVLHRLGRFVYTNDGIVQTVKFKHAICSPLDIRFQVSGYAYSWGIFIPLSTNFGNGTYFLDTGFASGFPRIAIGLFNNYASDLISSGKVITDNPPWLREIQYDRNGVKHYVNVRFIMLKMDKYGVTSPLLASIFPAGYRKNTPYYYGRYGVIGRDAARYGKLAFEINFKRARVCIGTLEAP